MFCIGGIIRLLINISSTTGFFPRSHNNNKCVFIVYAYKRGAERKKK